VPSVVAGWLQPENAEDEEERQHGFSARDGAKDRCLPLRLRHTLAPEVPPRGAEQRKVQPDDSS